MGLKSKPTFHSDIFFGFMHDDDDDWYRYQIMTHRNTLSVVMSGCIFSDG